jgi:hypothetical protein
MDSLAIGDLQKMSRVLRQDFTEGRHHRLEKIAAYSRLVGARRKREDQLAGGFS